MRIYFSFIVSLFIYGFSAADSPKVPSNIEVAGIKLEIKDGARKQIQADVDALTRYEKYYRNKLTKVDLYFPIIERVLKEENVPEDFKYLVIQESAFIPDAVSSANAVGFWQFKKPTGLEMGLTINSEVDERMNIVSSTRAAAGYMKKNNLFFDNWIYAVLAYYAGAGGAQKYANKKYFGKNKMDITKSTHWYVKKYLAHLIAFKDEAGKDDNLPFFLFEYNDGQGKSLNKIAADFDVESDLMFEYNKCFRKKRVPDDQKYTVIVPIGYDKAKQLASKNNDYYKPSEIEHKKGSSLFAFTKSATTVKPFYTEQNKYPVIKTSKNNEPLQINGRPGVIAQPGDTFDKLAMDGGISLSSFMTYNDLTSYDKVNPGQVYYYKKKYSKARTHYHTLLPGESMWELSQKYGVRLKKLLEKNRLISESDIKPGLIVWLRYIRPKNVEASYKNLGEILVVDSHDSIDTSEKSVESAEPSAMKQDTLFTENTMSEDENINDTDSSFIEIHAANETEREIQRKAMTSGELTVAAIAVDDKQERPILVYHNCTM